MKVFEGSSTKSKAQEAILEACSHWNDDFLPDILFAFHSTSQDSHAIAASLSEHFPNSLIVGCSTAGEWLGGKHQHDSLVLTAISSTNIRWSVAVAEQLDQFNAESCTNLCSKLLNQLDIQMCDLNTEHYFCLSLFDGMSRCEESTIAMLSAELGNIPLLGGSAGDDLKFENTFVLAAGQAWQNAAVFILAESKLPFKTIKHQHFIPGDMNTIITKADMAKRTVYHLDGMPAAERYAHLLGLNVEDLDTSVFSAHPLIYQHQQECYVRSIGEVGENNSLVFYCAIEEGMILNLCSHQQMLQQFEQTLQTLIEVQGKASLMFIFNCILRQLEAKSLGITQSMAKGVGEISQHSIGFDTYGEQWQGLHINQTMVALAIYDHD